MILRVIPIASFITTVWIIDSKPFISQYILQCQTAAYQRCPAPWHAYGPARLKEVSVLRAPLGQVSATATSTPSSRRLLRRCLYMSIACICLWRRREGRARAVL